MLQQQQQQHQQHQQHQHQHQHQPTNQQPTTNNHNNNNTNNTNSNSNSNNNNNNNNNKNRKKNKHQNAIKRCVVRWLQAAVWQEHHSVLCTCAHAQSTWTTPTLTLLYITLMASPVCEALQYDLDVLCKCLVIMRFSTPERFLSPAHWEQFHWPSPITEGCTCRKHQRLYPKARCWKPHLETAWLEMSPAKTS